MTYCYGILCHLQHQGLWKSSPSDSDVTKEEYAEAYSRFSGWLDQILGIRTERGGDVPSYFVGNFKYDRSQQLEFYDFSLLTPEFVRKLQEFLRQPENCLWRVGIPASDPRDILIIYPAAVCSDRVVPEPEQDLVVSAVSERHVEEDRRRVEEREHRIDRVRPYLADAYNMANEEANLLHLVYTESFQTPGGGTVRMWIVHPRSEGPLDLSCYLNTPRASLCERFYLLQGGVLTDTRRKKPAKAFVIAQWDIEEDPSRTFIMQRDGRTTTFSF